MTTPAFTPWILGLTGGIGSGKSAAAQRFIELGVHLVDADQAARWVVEPGRPALASIVERFGPGVLVQIEAGGIPLLARITRRSAEALALAGQATPEVVLLDWVMPGMDGVEEVVVKDEAAPLQRITLATDGSSASAKALDFLVTKFQPDRSSGKGEHAPIPGQVLPKVVDDEGQVGFVGLAGRCRVGDACQAAQHSDDQGKTHINGCG